MRTDAGGAYDSAATFCFDLYIGCEFDELVVTKTEQ